VDHIVLIAIEAIRFVCAIIDELAVRSIKA
jgi:hypothetical protein